MVTLQSKIRSPAIHSASPWQSSAHQPIISPVAKAVLQSELAAAKPICVSKGLEVYLLTAQVAPHIMQELGRIREIEFRSKGGGTGKAVDIDRYDTGLYPYQQLIAWDAEEQEIVSAYRCMFGEPIVPLKPEQLLATGELFHFSRQFKQAYLPHTVELGRLVVNQSAKRHYFGLFALWSGLVSLLYQYPQIHYFFGKVTIFPSYHPKALDLLLQFLRLYYPDPDQLVYPKPELQITGTGHLSELTALFTGANHDRDYQQLRRQLAALGESFPTTLRPYLKLALAEPVKHFGAAYNADFGGVIEVAILVPITESCLVALKRYVQ